MNLTLSLLIWPLVASTFASPPPVKEWRGIVPLRSTRADVERLLGPPESASGGVYVTEGERVSVTYAGRECDYGWRVPVDTVISFFVYPKEPPKVADLKLDEKRYERRRDVHITTLYYYVDQKEGINYTVDTGRGLVTGVEYYPALRDNALLCQPPPKAAAGEGGASPRPATKPAGKRATNSRKRRPARRKP